MRPARAETRSNASVTATCIFGHSHCTFSLTRLYRIFGACVSIRAVITYSAAAGELWENEFCWFSQKQTHFSFFDTETLSSAENFISMPSRIIHYHESHIFLFAFWRRSISSTMQFENFSRHSKKSVVYIPGTQLSSALFSFSQKQAAIMNHSHLVSAVFLLNETKTAPCAFPSDSPEPAPIYFTHSIKPNLISRRERSTSRGRKAKAARARWWEKWTWVQILLLPLEAVAQR